MQDIPGRVWLITGASRGLGLALTRRILARGDRVIATGRDVAAFDDLLADPDVDPTHVFALRLDVTDSPQNLKEIVNAGAAHWGRIDVVVNNAGTRELSTSEEADPDDYILVAKTNYLGVINVTNAVLPHFRKRREGIVIIMSSRSVYRDEIPGLCKTPAVGSWLYTNLRQLCTLLPRQLFMVPYGETLSAEVKPFNIQVMIVAPGAFDSGLALTTKPGNTIPDYDETRREMQKRLEERAKEKNPGDPVKGMDALVDVVRREGRAKGREGPLPLWLMLGDDAIADVRERVERIKATVDEWESVGTRVGKLD